MKFNEENRKKLAKKIVEDWDMKTLINYAEDQLEKHYANDKDFFKEELKNYG